MDKYTLGFWEKIPRKRILGKESKGYTWQWKEKTVKAINEIHAARRLKKDIEKIEEGLKSGNISQAMLFCGNDLIKNICISPLIPEKTAKKIIKEHTKGNLPNTIAVN